MNKQDLIDFENKIIAHYRDNRLPFVFHLSGGNEDQLIDIFSEISPNDYVLSNHRGHYHALLHGIPPEVVESHILNGRSMFIYSREHNYFTTAIIGGAPGIAAGVAMALKRKGSKQRVWCFVGDGNEDNGHLFEAARYVEGHDLPCTFVIESNNYSVNTTNEARWGKTHDLHWPFKCVRKYYYQRTHPHIRIDEFMDFSKAPKKGTDDDYFPHKDEWPTLRTPPRIVDGLSYKQSIELGNTRLGNLGTVFVGYGLTPGDAMGTLKGVDDSQKIEMPVAENLMVGMAMGIAMEGIRTCVFFERHDFMLVGADAIVNHLDKVYRLSQGQFKLPVTIRALCADGGPFYSGPTHSQDFTSMLREALTMPVFDSLTAPNSASSIQVAYDYAIQSQLPTMIVERKSLM